MHVHHFSIKDLLKFTILISIIIFLCIFSTQKGYFYGSRRSHKSKSLPPEGIVIYAATPFFGSNIDEYYTMRCADNIKKYCHISNDIEDSKNASAVLFHSRNFEEANFDILSQTRTRDQIYVLWTMESPTNDYIEVKKGFINWTMSYKRDSDIFYPYSVMVPSMNKNWVNYSTIWEQKTKEIIWLVSNCKTQNKREDVVREMTNRGLQIDIFGKCTSEPADCPRYDAKENCESKLMAPYKFAITIENSNCEDYVTEKFWRALGEHLIPIVMSRKYYRNLGIPDFAYIAIDDFDSIENLNGHLRNVSSDPQMYMGYHAWRDSFEILNVMGGATSTKIPSDYGFCNLCEKLRRDRGESVKYYETLDTWHSEEDQCDNGIGLKFV